MQLHETILKYSTPLHEVFANACLANLDFHVLCKTPSNVLFGRNGTKGLENLRSTV